MTAQHPSGRNAAHRADFTTPHIGFPGTEPAALLHGPLGETADWLPLSRRKVRGQSEPGTFPLAHGRTFRVGSSSAFEGKSRAEMRKAYGNADQPAPGRRLHPRRARGRRRPAEGRMSPRPRHPLQAADPGSPALSSSSAAPANPFFLRQPCRAPWPTPSAPPGPRPIAAALALLLADLAASPEDGCLAFPAPGPPRMDRPRAGLARSLAADSARARYPRTTDAGGAGGEQQCILTNKAALPKYRPPSPTTAAIPSASPAARPTPTASTGCRFASVTGRYASASLPRPWRPWPSLLPAVSACASSTWQTSRRTTVTRGAVGTYRRKRHEHETHPRRPARPRSTGSTAPFWRRCANTPANPTARSGSPSPVSAKPRSGAGRPCSAA